MEWDWEFSIQILPQLWEGVKVTIQATILGTMIAMMLGLVLAIARRSVNVWISRPVGFFAELIRGTPLLVQLYFLFYILPDLGLLLSPLTAGVVGLGLHYSTYTAEVYRTGIDAIPSGQWEASKATNLTANQMDSHYHPTSHSADDPGTGQLFCRDVQGNALAGCDHRAGVDESSAFCRQLSLQICGTDDDGRPVLFSGQCALGHLATQT